MGRKATVTTTAIFGLLTALVACSSAELPSKDCDENPKAKGCKKSSATTASSAAPMAETPVTAPTPPPIVPGMRDGGYDSGLSKPGGGTPALPQADVACRDLLNCCARVQDTIERAACYGIGYNSSSSSCANAIIAYQVFGGCSHSSFGMPDIFNPDGTVNPSRDCYYLEQQCNTYGDCGGYYNAGCNIQSGTGTGTGGGSFSCDYKNQMTDDCGRSDYNCCLYGDFYCEPWGTYCDIPLP